MKSRAVFAGSFNPFTEVHLDLFKTESEYNRLMESGRANAYKYIRNTMIAIYRRYIGRI